MWQQLRKGELVAAQWSVGSAVEDVVVVHTTCIVLERQWREGIKGSGGSDVVHVVMPHCGSH